jgi:hypothetical protein
MRKTERWVFPLWKYLFLSHFFGSWNISRNMIVEMINFNTDALFLRNYFNFILWA